MRLDIITPDKTLYSGDDVKSVILPGLDGGFELLDKHTALISALGEGDIVVKTSSNTEKINIKSGLVECNKNIVSILVEA